MPSLFDVIWESSGICQKNTVWDVKLLGKTSLITTKITFFCLIYVPCQSFHLWLQWANLLNSIKENFHKPSAYTRVVIAPNETFTSSQIYVLKGYYRSWMCVAEWDLKLIGILMTHVCWQTRDFLVFEFVLKAGEFANTFPPRRIRDTEAIFPSGIREHTTGML